MNDNLEKLDKMPIPKAVLSNALPAMIAMIMVLVYNMADLFFVGQLNDSLQVAAVSMATPIFLIFMSLGNIFGIGGTSMVSRFLGAGKKELVKKVSSFCFWAAIVTGLILSVSMYLRLDNILALLGASEELWELVKSYLQILFISGPFIVISSCFSNLLRAEGQAGKAMVGMLIGNVINIVLDPIFILTLDMGIEGAAIATVIGNICGGTYYLVYLFRSNTILSTKIKDFTISNGVMKNVLVIGIPASLSSILMSISQIVLNAQMANYGDLAVAGIGVAMKVTMITSMICIGLGQGIQPLLGFSIGAQNKKRYQGIIKFSLIFAFLLSSTLTLLCYIGLEGIVGAFLTDVESFEYAYSFSQILLSTSFIFGMLFVFANALQAAGAATESLIVNVSRQGLVFIPMLFILGSIWGEMGLVIAQPVADITSFILSIAFYMHVSKKVFLVEEQSERTVKEKETYEKIQDTNTL